MSKTLASATLVMLLSAFATAQAGGRNDQPKLLDTHKVSAPEIDAASAGAALVLLVGGMYVLYRRRTVSKD